MASTLTTAQMAGMTPDQMANYALGQLGESDIDITTDASSAAPGSESNPIVLQTENPFTGSAQTPGLGSSVADLLGQGAGDVAQGAAAVPGVIEGAGSIVGKTLGNLLGPIWWVVLLLVAGVAVYFMVLK